MESLVATSIIIGVVKWKNLEDLIFGITIIIVIETEIFTIKNTRSYPPELVIVETAISQ